MEPADIRANTYWLGVVASQRIPAGLTSSQHPGLSACSSIWASVVHILAATCLVCSPVAAQPVASNKSVVSPDSWANRPLGRRHPAYQVFAHQLALPSIATESNHVILVGATVRFDIVQSEQMRIQLKPLAAQFGVPLPVMEAFLKEFKANPPPDVESAAQELSLTVVDYNYLLEKFTQYKPLPADERTRTAALKLLAAGELEQAWAIFNSLPRPSPPGGLRQMSQSDRQP